ncbi:MAG: hypothetical protein HFG55_08735 [Lachnospiraceae bacterium]|nr:hypothetical protein [Lachnospiraceae bacterium]
MHDQESGMDRWKEIIKQNNSLTKMQLAQALEKELSDSPRREDDLQDLAETAYLQFFCQEEENDDLELEWKKWQIEYQEYLRATVRFLSRKNISAKQFYKELADVIWNSAFFNEKSRVFALHYYLNSGYCPYFELDKGILMDEGEFRENLQKVRLLCSKLRFIMLQRYEQKTERAARVNDVIAQAENEKEKAVLMAWFLNFLESRKIESGKKQS